MAYDTHYVATAVLKKRIFDELNKNDKIPNKLRISCI